MAPKAGPELESYVRAVCSLTWKMALQTPEMTFMHVPPNGKMDPSMCEPHVNSADPQRYKTIKCVVFPGLCHGDKILQKAIVIYG